MKITKATLQNLNCAKYLKTCVCVCVCVCVCRIEVYAKIGGKRLVEDFYRTDRAESIFGRRAESFSDIERSRDAETGNWKYWIFSFTAQAKLFTKKLFVDDFGNHNTSKYHRILQEKSLQKAYCFIFINNTQNKQRIPYKQPQ